MYHITSSGDPKPCTARKGRCPFGSAAEHYSTPEAAYAALATDHSLFATSGGRKSLEAARAFYGGSFVTPYRMALPTEVEEALSDLSTIGNPLIVGGAVRDAFAGAANKDIDVEVHGTDMDTLVRTLRSKAYRVDEVGRQFGVLKVSKPGGVDDLDVAVPRRENRTGAGHRSFEVELDSTMTVQEAAERRDFTFNAMMYDHARGVLVDPAGGQQDFEAGVMRHVSPKFAEDPLRVLRGAQFAARFGLTLAPSTAEFMQNLRGEYSTLSKERVREEWGKFFSKGTAPVAGIRVLQESGWDDVTPDLRTALASERTQAALATLVDAPRELREVFGAAHIGRAMASDDARGAFYDVALMSKEQRGVARAYSTLTPEALATTFQRKSYMKDEAPRGFAYSHLRSFAEGRNSSSLAQVASTAVTEGVDSAPEPDWVQGRDILPLIARKPGPWLATVLREVRSKQYAGEVATPQEALAEALRLSRA
jgi:tRNA nucleotidyltransferase/poly(A) polymerase